MVGGAAAALLFHTLQIYIFTTAPEWPACNVFTHQLKARFMLAGIRTPPSVRTPLAWLAYFPACIRGAFGYGPM